MGRDQPAWKDAVSGEDPRFYEHGGVDIQHHPRRARAPTCSNQDVQGGSSITQQLREERADQQRRARGEDRGGEGGGLRAATRDLSRAQAQGDAPSPSRRSTRRTRSCSATSTSRRSAVACGIESAASYYFGKHAADLTLAEAASLIAIVNHPRSSGSTTPRARRTAPPPSSTASPCRTPTTRSAATTSSARC